MISRRLRAVARRPRWDEYGAILDTATRAGYRIASLEPWLAENKEDGERTLVLRHDVDDDPRSAWLLSRVEKSRGVTSTWYFRWSTFDRRLIARLRSEGHQVGLHYETLTRYALSHHLSLPSQVTESVLAECRQTLRDEIACFASLTGSCASVCAHGHDIARAIEHANSVLLADQRYSDFGVLSIADDPAVRERVDCWVSDGDGVSARWNAGVLPLEALSRGATTILFNTHPHHWRSGPPIFLRRTLRRVTGVARFGRDWDRGVPENRAWQRSRRLSALS